MKIMIKIIKIKINISRCVINFTILNCAIIIIVIINNVKVSISSAV